MPQFSLRLRLQIRVDKLTTLMQLNMRIVNKISISARQSPLSRAQADEVLLELPPVLSLRTFDPLWVETTGDKDQKTSLRTLG